MRTPLTLRSPQVTLNLPGSLGTYVRAVFSLAVILTYPLQLFPAMQALEDALGLSRPMRPECTLEAPAKTGSATVAAQADARPMRRLLLQCTARTCLVCAAFLFSLVAPYDTLIGLAGGLCAVPLAFIFPGWFHMKICKERSAASTAIDLSLIIFGLLMAPIAVVAAIISWH